ncbi:hypothetical protein AGDE_10711 [Angomonas deanei]|nr:hypothetical protein AGDE_10711 [Angomonas deanei]|eukprot:EPY27548.1 hypothetical protein AGDE_10711 [Angomonas deanei]
MVKVTFNNVEGDVQINGRLVSFTGGEDQMQFSATEVGQLLRSKRDDKVCKIVVEGGKQYLASFDSLADRERFIEQLVRAQGGVEEKKNDTWLYAAVLQPAVDLGVVTEEELQAILDEECQRGVVQSIGALESLIHPVTYQLVPITEQVESDILREIPALAVVFGRHVVSEETRQSFWEAVVRKYFCFANTFLEEELQDAEGSTAAVPKVENLNAINALSRSALPAVTNTAPTEEEEGPGVEAELLLAAENEQETVLPHEKLFYAARPLGEDKAAPLDTSAVQVSLREAVRQVRVEADGAPPFTGHHVLSKLPSETQDKETLAMLRTFWRGTTAERKMTLDKYGATTEPKKKSLITTLCLKRARDVVSE